MQMIRRSNAHTWWRRAYTRLRALLGAAVKTHRVHWVTIGGVRYKRVTFSHASEALRVMHNLEQVAPLARLPAPVYQHERRVWLKFVAGAPMDAGRPAHVGGMLALFADLYRHEPRRLALADTLIHQRLLADLAFLREVGALSPALGAAACAIDVEALYAGSLLGIGLAKARLRWLDMAPEALLDALSRRGAPDLRPQFDYAALSQLAAYSKQQVFRGRRRSIRAADFEQLLGKPAA